MRVCYLTCGLHILGTYNAVLAWLVKKAEDNQVELPFIFPVGVLVFQFSRERRRENLMMVTSITYLYLYLYLQCQLHGLYICHSSPLPTSDFSSSGSISIDSIPLHQVGSRVEAD